MKNFILLFSLFALFSCSKDNGLSTSNLNTDSKAVYDALWGKSFGNFTTDESIRFDDPMEFTDEKDNLNVVTFKVKSIENYVANSSDLSPGKGLMINGENGYYCKVYKSDTIEGAYIVSCFLNNEERFDRAFSL